VRYGERERFDAAGAGMTDAPREAAVVAIREANEHFRYSLRKGMEGWDVLAIQIALNGTTPSPGLAEDGIFGPRTDTAVRTLQSALHVTVDGIIGPMTQAAMCVAQATRAEAGQVPKGLLRGICMGESGGIVPCTSERYINGTRDYGPFQVNLSTSGPEAPIHRAFVPSLAAGDTAADLQQPHSRYRALGCAEERAWRLAVLHYNWPAAADQIAEGHGDTWTYIESGTGARRKLADRAPWIVAFHVPNVETGWEWCTFYIDSKVLYVSEWKVV